MTLDYTNTNTNVVDSITGIYNLHIICTCTSNQKTKHTHCFYAGDIEYYIHRYMFLLFPLIYILYFRNSFFLASKLKENTVY